MTTDKKLVNRPNRQTPKTKRLYSTTNSVLDELRSQTVEKFQTNTYEGISEWYGVVLRKPEGNPDPSDKRIRVKIRVPEVHAHLPVPKNAFDNNIIDLYPEYLGPADLGPIIPGQIVRVTHQDTNHAQFRHENGIILESTPERAFSAGYSNASAICKGNSSTGVTPTQGKPITGANLAKTVSNSNPRKVNSTTDSARITEADRQKNKAPESTNSYAKTTSAQEDPSCGRKSLLRNSGRRRRQTSEAVANRGNYADFKKAVGRRESGNKYDSNRWYRTWLSRDTGRPTKKQGISYFWGYWQLGHEARSEVGAHPQLVPWNKFIQPSLQEKLGDRWWKLKYIEATSTRSLRNAIAAGEVHGQKIDLSGIMGMAHITGIESVKKFIRTGKPTYDGLNTPNTEYLSKFYGYDVSAVKSVDWDRKKARDSWWNLEGAAKKYKRRGVWVPGGKKIGLSWYPNTTNPPAAWKVTT